jgi:hypothetical protein
MWTTHENHPWQAFLSMRHEKYHDFNKSNKGEQAFYWKWRDAHPDAH